MIPTQTGGGYAPEPPVIIDRRELCATIDTSTVIVIGIFEVDQTTTTPLRVEDLNGTPLTAGTGAGEYQLAATSDCGCDSNYYVAP